MTDAEVVESLNNAWRAMCRQYDKNPDETMRWALNIVSRVVAKVEYEVGQSHKARQITIDEWIAVLNGKDGYKEENNGTVDGKESKRDKVRILEPC